MKELGRVLVVVLALLAGFVWGAAFEKDRQFVRMGALKAVADSLNTRLNECEGATGDYGLVPDTTYISPEIAP